MYEDLYNKGIRLVFLKEHHIDTDTYKKALPGTRKTKRFQTIKVQWQNERLQTRCKTFTGWTAEIIQHEIDPPRPDPPP